MSQATTEILEKLKTLTLVESVELASQMEETFSINTNLPIGGMVIRPADANPSDDRRAEQEQTTYDVILELVAADKRVAALKAIRRLTDLGLKEAKDFCSELPKPVKEGVSKSDAEAAKAGLEAAGGKVTIR